MDRSAVSRSVTPVLDRMADKFLVGDDCWPWIGSASAQGYGRIYVHPDGPRQAHRVLYEIMVGPIPDGLQLDHLCKNPACVRPDHLEPVTGAENRRRSEGPAGINARKTHCKNGHPLDADDLIVRDGRSSEAVAMRSCRACHNARQRAYNSRTRERQRAYSARYRSERRAEKGEN